MKGITRRRILEVASASGVLSAVSSLQPRLAMAQSYAQSRIAAQPVKVVPVKVGFAAKGRKLYELPAISSPVGEPLGIVLERAGIDLVKWTERSDFYAIAAAASSMGFGPVASQTAQGALDFSLKSYHLVVFLNRFMVSGNGVTIQTIPIPATFPPRTKWVEVVISLEPFNPRLAQMGLALGKTGKSITVAIDPDKDQWIGELVSMV